MNDPDGLSVRTVADTWNVPVPRLRSGAGRMTARVKLLRVSMAVDAGPCPEVDGQALARVERHARFEQR